MVASYDYLSDSPLAQEDLAPIDDFRRQHQTAVLVVMFTDMLESTQLADRYGELRAQRLRADHDFMVRGVIERGNSGRVIKTIGDSVMCVFAEPAAAVQRAVEIQQRLFEYNRDHPEQPAIRVRIGMHLGQVTVDDTIQRDVFGLHVCRAARVESLAQGGQILMTLPVYDSAFSWLKDQPLVWRDHGEYRLKGLSQATQIFEVLPNNIGAPRKPPKEGSLSRWALYAFGTICLLLLSFYAVKALFFSEPEVFVSPAEEVEPGGADFLDESHQ